MTIDYASRARALVGTRFRTQGRGSGGLDCLGVVLATFGIPADAAPSDYQLRGDYFGRTNVMLPAYFRPVRRKTLSSGDLLVLAPAADQLHFAIRTDEGFVHAHAGIRRVVETPGLPAWKIVGAWRRRRR